MKKRGQAAVFIIIGVVIVGIVVLIFLFSGGGKTLRIGGSADEENAESFMESCLEDEVRKGIELVSLQGGSFQNPLNISYKLEEEDEPVDISYLCYSRLNNDYCSNQQPMLFQHYEEELGEYLGDEIPSCFGSLVNGLENSGYEISEDNYESAEIIVKPRRVLIDVDANLVITKAEQTTRYENFDVSVGTKVYELLNVANRIVNDKARSCRFDSNTYMRLNPEFKITAYTTTDSSEVYIIEHKEVDEEFRFAIRNCVSSGGPFQ